MTSTPEFLLTLGCLLLLGLVTSVIGRRTFLPRVTLLLIFGMAVGGEGLDLIPELFTGYFDLIATMALLMIGFLLGGKLTAESLRFSLSRVLWISISTVVITTLVVSIGLVMAGAPLGVAVLLGCIAAATAPAAVFDVVTESHYKGPFSELLLSIVAIDDAWALIIFAVGVAIVSSLNGHSGGDAFIGFALKDIGGALLLGLAIGVPAALLTGRIKPGQPMLTEALGLVFICGGLAIWFEVSFLIAVMTLGAVIANVAKHHEYPFHAIEGVEWPFMVVFFILAGASLEFSALQDVGIVGVVFIICRIIGKLLGARVGGKFSHADKLTKQWMGPALLPQAGVSIGMVLIAATNFPEYRQVLLSVVIGATVFFEIIGPIFTRMALDRTKLIDTSAR